MDALSLAKAKTNQRVRADGGGVRASATQAVQSLG